jgi:hypothetical protein
VWGLLLVPATSCSVRWRVRWRGTASQQNGEGVELCWPWLGGGVPGTCVPDCTCNVVLRTSPPHLAVMFYCELESHGPGPEVRSSRNTIYAALDLKPEDVGVDVGGSKFRRQGSAAIWYVYHAVIVTCAQAWGGPECCCWCD